MDAFRVWVRPLQSASRVRVEGMNNALWLLKRVSQSFFFKSSEPVHEGADSNCSFEVSYGSETSCSTFERLLSRIPEVKLMREPA